MPLDEVGNKAEGLFPGESAQDARSIIQVPIVIQVPASADASTELAATGYVPLPIAGRVREVWVNQESSLSDDTQNYCAFNCVDQDGNVVASKAIDASDGSDDVAANTPFALTVDDSLDHLDAGDALGISVTKTGTGISSVAGTMTVWLELRGSTAR